MRSDYKKDIEEIPKYKKRSKGSTSQAEYEAKHKCQYKECILIYEGRPYKASYCIICGKVRDWDSFKEKTDYGYWLLPDKEIFNRYNYLEKFEVDNLFTRKLQVNICKTASDGG